MQEFHQTVSSTVFGHQHFVSLVIITFYAKRRSAICVQCLLSMLENRIDSFSFNGQFKVSTWLHASTRLAAAAACHTFNDWRSFAVCCLSLFPWAWIRGFIFRRERWRSRMVRWPKAVQTCIDISGDSIVKCKPSRSRSKAKYGSSLVAISCMMMANEYTSASRLPHSRKSFIWTSALRSTSGATHNCTTQTDQGAYVNTQCHVDSHAAALSSEHSCSVMDCVNRQKPNSDWTPSEGSYSSSSNLRSTTNCIALFTTWCGRNGATRIHSTNCSVVSAA